MVAKTIRFDDDVSEELENLAKLLNMSQNTVVNMLVRQEYNKYYEDPVVKRAISQMNELREVLERFNEENKAN